MGTKMMNPTKPIYRPRVTPNLPHPLDPHRPQVSVGLRGRPARLWMLNAIEYRNASQPHLEPTMRRFARIASRHVAA
jgi:hypothetical protein